MKQKYDPHIRVRFDLFDDPQFRTIPNKHKAHCLCVLICLLKFVNNKTLQCYPRKATISSMTGLSYSTIYRATVWLIRVKIVSKKRLPSTLLYTINSKYIVGNRVSSHIDNRDRSGGLSDVSASSLYKRTTTITIIDKLIKEVVDKGGDQSKIISNLATLPADTLKKAIIDNDNIYYSRLALREQSEKRGKLVDLPKNIVDNIRKKTHFGYQKAIHKRRDLDGRKAKTESFLSELNKKK
jgi:hypothetical protein